MLAQKGGNNTPTAPSFAKYDPFSCRCKALYNAGHIHYNPEGQAVELNPVVADRKEGRLPVSPRCLQRRSEEHTSELQSLMRISYAVFCLKKKNADIKQSSQHTAIINAPAQTLPPHVNKKY